MVLVMMQITESKMMTHNERTEHAQILHWKKANQIPYITQEPKYCLMPHIIIPYVILRNIFCLQGLILLCLVCYYNILCKDVQQWRMKKLSLEVSKFNTKISSAWDKT